MKSRYPIRCLDAFIAAAIKEHRRRHAERLASDDTEYRALAAEWRERWDSDEQESK